MSLENMITDRTERDVARVEALAEKAWQDMTAEERTEWMSPMKGSYNYTDLNRVEEAVQYVAMRLKEYGYLSEEPVTRSWTVDDKPTEEDFVRHVRNMVMIRDASRAFRENTPDIPFFNVDHFGVADANAFEQILVDVDKFLDNMRDAWLFLNEPYSGEV